MYMFCDGWFVFILTKKYDHAVINILYKCYYIGNKTEHHLLLCPFCTVEDHN